MKGVVEGKQALRWGRFGEASSDGGDKRRETKVTQPRMAPREQPDVTVEIQ